ncbi:MAG: hypothetical protein IPK60_08420 [Sandaracinaceae bacterium]|jgi:hypothetical protein|nr:hypothetical protein [Sandaracinaceae bacterium]
MTFDAEALHKADRELGSLGREANDVSELLARHGNDDRSLSRIDELLADLQTGLQLAPLPAIPEPTAKAPKAPKAKKAPAPKRESVAPVESALRDVHEDEIPPIPPPSLPPPRAENYIDTVEREIPSEAPHFADDDLDVLTPAVKVPSMPPRAITLDDLDVDDVPASERPSSPQLLIEAGAPDESEFEEGPTSDRAASTQMIESPTSDVPPSTAGVFEDESDVQPISSIRPGPAPGLLSENELFDDSAFTEVGEDQSDVFSLDVSTGEKSIPTGPVLVDDQHAADLAALLEGELDPDEFGERDVEDDLDAKSTDEDDSHEDDSDEDDSDEMEMLIDEEGSIEVAAPVDDEPTSPSVPPPAATASSPPTPPAPPEGTDPQPTPSGNPGPGGKGFFKKIFGR